MPAGPTAVADYGTQRIRGHCMAHDFNVRLSGIELSSSEEQQLNKAIQSAVLGHLA